MAPEKLHRAVAGVAPDCLLSRDLSPGARQQLTRLAKTRQIATNRYLCRQNSPHDRVFQLLAGSAAVERLSASGRRQILAFMFAGDVVGLADSETFEYGVRSLTEVSYREFPQKGLFRLSEEVPKLHSNLKSLQSMLLALLFDQLYLLGQKKAHEKTCTFLLQLLARMPGAQPEKLDLPMTRLDIADYLGLTSETVIRSFARLRDAGVLSMASPQSVTLHDLARVQALGEVR